MKRLLSKAVVVAVAAVFFSAFGAAPAGAASVGGAVLTGTVSPDPVAAKGACVTATTNPLCSFPVGVSMTGTAAGVVGTTPATCAITYNSTGTTNVATGSGTGSLNCNGSFVTGGSVSVNCSVGYTQVGGAIVVTGSCGGSAPGSLNAVCGIQVATTTIAAECTFVITP